MTIRKGETWGGPSPSSDEVTVAGDDRELAMLAYDHWRRGEYMAASVGTGDLLATLGLDEPRPVRDRWRFAVDLGLFHNTEGGRSEEVPFVAHLIANRALWRGEAAVVMNAPLMTTRWFGPLRLGPRAHPNDGLVDITIGALGWRQRVEAARRARTGSHLPHPDLRTMRVSKWSHTFDRAIPVRLDGRSVGSYRTVEVRVIPDAFELVA